MPVAVLRAVLQVRTREETPLGWAATPTNLAAALVRRGEWLGEEEGAVKSCEVSRFMRNRRS